MDKENVNETKSGKVLKFIYLALIAVIMINCVILIVAMLNKNKFQPIRGRHETQVINKSELENRNTP